MSLMSSWRKLALARAKLLEAYRLGTRPTEKALTDCGKAQDELREAGVNPFTGARFGFYCIWTEDEDGNWDSSCENTFVIMSGSPDENGFKFCHYCGRRIKTVPHTRTNT